MSDTKPREWWIDPEELNVFNPRNWAGKRIDLLGTPEWRKKLVLVIEHSAYTEAVHRAEAAELNWARCQQGCADYRKNVAKLSLERDGLRARVEEYDRLNMLPVFEINRSLVATVDRLTAELAKKEAGIKS